MRPVTGAAHPAGLVRGGNDHPVSRLHPGSVFGGQAVLGISQTRKETVMATGEEKRGAGTAMEKLN